MPETTRRRGKDTNEQAYLRRANRAIFKANTGCLRAAKQVMIGRKQAAPGDETTKLIQPTLPMDDMSEEGWAGVNEDIESCKNLAWKAQPLAQEKDFGETGNDDANLHIPESLRELAKKSVPNTITFIRRSGAGRVERLDSKDTQETAG